MELDLANTQSESSRPSAMMLDLGSDSRVNFGRSNTRDQSSQKQSCSSSSLSPVVKSKQSPSFLPPIAGAKSAGVPMGKSSAHYRSGSVDSCLWGVAPVGGRREFSS